MTTDVDWVADTTPGTFATFANYKKITVKITNNRNGAVLTSVVTYVAPPGRSCESPAPPAWRCTS